jgi:hypothetical protein
MGELETKQTMVRSETLTGEAHAALWYAMANLPENHPRWGTQGFPKRAFVLRAYQAGLDRAKELGEVSLRGWRQGIEKGLRELAERGLVALTSDGHLGWDIVDVDFTGVEGGQILLTQ